jgi:hypothetical protein
MNEWPSRHCHAPASKHATVAAKATHVAAKTAHVAANRLKFAHWTRLDRETTAPRFRTAQGCSSSR